MPAKVTSCKLVKPDQTTVNIPVILVGEFCTDPSGKPYTTKNLLAVTGISQAIVSKKFAALTEAEKQAVLRMGANADGSIVINLEIEREAKKAQREADEKAKRDAGNALLNQHGFVWKKGFFYIDGWLADIHSLPKLDGENAPAWLLLDQSGKTVVAIVEGKAVFGSVGAILASLDAEKQAKAEAEKQAKAKSEIEKYFAETPSLTPKVVTHFSPLLHFPNQGFDVYGGGVEYAIDPQDCFSPEHLWQICNNGSDGGDWSHNNYETGGAGAIASAFPFSHRIADLMREVMEVGANEGARCDDCGKPLAPTRWGKSGSVAICNQCHTARMNSPLRPECPGLPGTGHAGWSE